MSEKLTEESGIRCAVIHLGRSGAGPIIAQRLAQEFDKCNALSGLVTAVGATKPCKATLAPLHVLEIRTYSSTLGAVLRSISLPFHLLKFYRFLRKTDTNMVVSAMPALWQFGFAAVSRLAGCVYVSSIHDVTMHLGEQSTITEFLVGLESRFATGFIFYSDGSAALAKDTGPFQGKPHVVAKHGPLVDVYDKRPTLRTLADPIRIGVVGRIQKYKGVGRGVEALRVMTEAGIEATMEVWGSGDPRIIEELKAESDITVREGWIPDEFLPVLVRQFDIILVPYLEASQSGIVSVAQSQGVPTVVTPVGSLAEQVTETNSGLVAASTSAIDIADALIALTRDEDLRVALGDNGRAALSAGGDYSWAAAAQKITQRFAGLTRN